MTATLALPSRTLSRRRKWCNRRPRTTKPARNVVRLASPRPPHVIAVQGESTAALILIELAALGVR
jgi:hypothetical protein